MSGNTRQTPARLSPAKTLALGFLAIILSGSLLLKLPIAAEPGVRITWLQALFTATSAVCVTGLVVVDTASSYSLFGELVILSLIQLGGLGFMLFATSLLVLARRRISLRNRILLHETMSMPGLSGVVRTTLRFMLVVFAVEITGAALLSFRFIPLYGWKTGLYYGVFHAISAFCNAGFDLFGAAGSLTQFHSDALVLLTISGLIIIGGMGFAVVVDLLANRLGFRKLHLHSKIVVVMTLGLLLFGALGIAALEWRNPGTLAFEGARPGDKLLNAWFQSVTARTAGFNALPQNSLREASKVLTSALMFIGASPASTGGGIKTTTLFVLLVLIRSVFVGRSDVNAFRRRLPLMLIRTALSIFLISLVLLVGGAMLMSALEEGKGISMMDLVYEQVSALATVGLSSAGTGGLSHPTQVWLVLLMYFGRVGPLTMMLSFSKAGEHQSQGVRYAEEQIYVG